MRVWDWVLGRFARRGSRGERDEEIAREIEAHIAAEAEERAELGVGAEEARFAARRAMGNTTRIAEEVREVWGWRRAERLCMDLKYGARALRKSLGFTAVAVLTLAVGIGANTAIFSVLDAVMLRGLPFPDADRLVRIYSTKNGALIVGYANPGGPSGADLRDFAQNSRSLEGVVAYDFWRKNVSFGVAGGEPEQKWVGLVPAAYFEILRVQPVTGRLFTKEEGEAGKDGVAAIGERLWRQRYGADSAILGRKILINDEPYTIIAVMPDAVPEWMERGRVEIWTPQVAPDMYSEQARGSRGWAALGKLKSGVAVEQAQAELSTIAAGLAAKYPVDEGVGVRVARLSETRAASMKSMLLLLASAVGLILLMACSNLANLLLARNSARQRELALRTALGSGRGGLVRQLLAETLELTLLGGTTGLALASAGVAILRKVHPPTLVQLNELGVNWRVLGFTLAASVATTLIVGLAPALAGSRVNLVDALKEGGRSNSAGRRGTQMRSALVMTEVAMSLMLLVGAGLLVQSILRLERQGLGVRQDHLLKGHMYMPRVRYADSTAITRFSDELAGRVRSLPGVTDATITTIWPPRNGWFQMFEIPGRVTTRVQDVPKAEFGVTDAHYVRTMGIPLLRGRDFSESDTATSAKVALINRELEREYFGGQDPIGVEIHVGPPAFMNLPPGANTTDAADVRIVGVIGDFKNAGLTKAPEPLILVLYAQHPLVNYGFKDIVTRTAAEPRLLAPEIARQLHAMDADMPFSEVQTMDEIVETQTGGQRFGTILLGLFAAVGLALAVVGIYGLMAYLVARRTQELAVRMALGAQRRDILWLVVKRGLTMAAAGCGIGLAGAVAARQAMRGILFGISAVDPPTLAAGTALLLAVGVAASAVPGVRAIRVELTEALRQE